MGDMGFAKYDPKWSWFASRYHLLKFGRWKRSSTSDSGRATHGLSKNDLYGTSTFSGTVWGLGSTIFDSPVPRNIDSTSTALDA